MLQETTAKQERSEIQRMLDAMEREIGRAENYAHRLKDTIKPVITTSPRPKCEEATNPVKGCESPLGQGLYVFNDRLEAVNDLFLELLDECKL